MFTNPGPFGIRTIELGEYFGVFDGAQLVAMAGSSAGRTRQEWVRSAAERVNRAHFQHASCSVQ